MIVNRINNIESNRSHKKNKKREKSEECESLFLKTFIENDYAIYPNTSDIKITDRLKMEKIYQIHHIKVRTLNSFITNIENIVKNIKEIQRLFIYYLINV
jgi:hypothetical protein